MAHDDLAILDKFIGDEGLEEYIRRWVNKPFKRIVLRGNCLGEKGAAILADYLSKTEDVEELSLEWNQIGSSGARHLARALERNVSLTSLDLRNNNIKSDGAEELAKALEINKSLKALDLRWNKLEDPGVLCFKASILNRIPKLALQVSGNYLTGTTALSIGNWSDGHDEAGDESKSDVGGVMNFARTAESQSQHDQMMKAEAVQLRKDMVAMQEQIEHLHKQLEASALQVNSVEQKVLKEAFRADTAEERLKSTDARVAQYTEEIASLTRAWENDRQEAATELRASLKVKDEEISKVMDERDQANTAARRDEQRAERLQHALDEQSKAMEAERKGVSAELGSLQSALTDMTLSDSHKSGQIASLDGRVKLSEAKVEQLEKELASTRESSDATLRKEMKQREEMEGRIKADYEAQLSALTDKTLRQSKELEIVYKKTQALQSELASKVAAAEAEKDKAVTKAREDEAKRVEATLADQKQKIDMFLSGRTELQKRCDEYLKELNDGKDIQKKANEQMAAQVAAAEKECERLRATVSDMRAELTTSKKAEGEARARTDELSAEKARLSDLNEDQAAQLEQATNDRTSLKTKVREMELAESQAQAKMTMMFHNVAETVTAAVQREFDQLQNSNSIPSVTGKEE